MKFRDDGHTPVARADWCMKEYDRLIEEGSEYFVPIGCEPQCCLVCGAPIVKNQYGKGVCLHATGWHREIGDIVEAKVCRTFTEADLSNIE